MTRMFKFAASLALASVTMLTPAIVGLAPAAAQATSQACAVPDGAIGPVGAFSSVFGNVSINGANGFVPAVIDTPVFGDSQVTTGPSSGGVISIGAACQITVGANTTVTFVVEPGRIIVSQTVGGLVGGGLGSVAVPLAIGAGVVGLTAVTVGLGNDEAVSRR